MSQMTIEFGVGKELRAARLKAELKVTDVADELNLRVEHIIAIEKDNYAELPGATYIVGFVKSYAKLVGLNDVHLIDRLMESGFIPNLAPPKKTVDDELAEPVDKSLVGVSFLVLILVSVLALVYFLIVADSTKHAPATENGAIEELIDENADMQSAPKGGSESEEEMVLGQEELIPMLIAEQKIKETAFKIAKDKVIGTKPEGARVMLTALEDAWYQVYNPKTNKTYLNAVLKAGHSVWLENDTDALIDLGRPHKVAMTIDGKGYGLIGPSWGGVVKKLPADANYLIHSYYGEGLDKKSYNRWLKGQD